MKNKQNGGEQKKGKVNLKDMGSQMKKNISKTFV